MRKNLKTIIFIGYIGVCCMLMFGVNAEAYIDPSVATYLIQAIAGIIVAVGAAVGIHLQKVKKRVSNKLGIDENKNKEVETDDIIIKPQAESLEDK